MMNDCVLSPPPSIVVDISKSATVLAISVIPQRETNSINLLPPDPRWDIALLPVGITYLPVRCTTTINDVGCAKLHPPPSLLTLVGGGGVSGWKR